MVHPNIGLYMWQNQKENLHNTPYYQVSHKMELGLRNWIKQKDV